MHPRLGEWATAFHKFVGADEGYTGRQAKGK